MWLGVTWLMTGQNAVSQPDVKHFSNLSIEEGLSQSSVYTIAQDKKGFMWFGTRNGLNRYDSRHVVVYQTRNGVANSLPSNIVNSLILNRQGQLWVGTSKGIAFYRHQQDDFQAVNPRIVATGKLADSTINTLLEDRQQRIWFGTPRGLFRIQANTNRCDRLVDLTDGHHDLSNQTIRTIYEGRDQTIWVGTSAGLSRLKPTRAGLFELTNFFLHAADSIYHNTSNGVNAIAEDRFGRLWVGTDRNGIALLDQRQGNVLSWNPAPGLDLSTQTVRTILPDGKGNFWVGTMTGLHIIAQDGSRFTTHMNQPIDPSSLSDNSIRSLFRDRDGSFWVGSYFGGVSMYSPLARQFGSYRPVDSRGGMPFKISGPMLSASNPAQRWLGTEDKGLFLLNADKTIAHHYSHDPKNSQSLTNDKVKCLLAEGPNGLWVGTLKGLNYIDLRKRTVTRYLHEPNNPHSLPDDHIYDLKRDAQGKLWIATYFAGLCQFDEKTNSFTSLRHQPDRQSSISSDNTTSLLLDSRQQLWVCTIHGLNRKITGQNAFVRYYQQNGDSTSLSSNHAVCLLEDRQHRLWVGTRDGGLNLLLPDQRSFRHFTTTHGLPSNTVFGIQEDQRGRLWISTDKGLAQFDPQTNRFISYDRHDGLICKEFTPNSTYQDERGNLYFGGYNGIVMFHPDSIRRNTKAPKLAFTQLRLFNQPVAELADELNVDSEDGLTFTYQQNVFSLDFAAFNYINSPKNRYAYQLVDFDKDWNYVSEPQATYMNLPAGNYLLRIKGTNNDDVWNSKPLELKITVLPPPWKTGWAYGLYVLTFLGLLRLWSGFNQSRLQLAHDLQVEHDEKTRQQELHQIKLNFFTEIAHEIRTPLTLVKAPIEVLASQYAGDMAVQKQLSIMRNSTDRLLRLLNQLLDFRKHETGNIQLQKQEVDLVAFLRTITDSFAEHARTHRITLLNESEVATLHTWIDAEELEKVVSNLLLNAFKFTPTDGTVSVRLQQDFTLLNGEENAVILIEDTGQGISAGDIDHIFNQFYQVNQPKTRDSGFGLGLALSKHIIEQHGGQINVESRKATSLQSGYTRFTISLPVTVSGPLPTPTKPAFAPEPSLSLPQAQPPVGPPIGIVNTENADRPIVLLVEDQDDIRIYIRHLFSDTYQVIEAADGAAGWEKASRLLPDIVIADVAMPIMDGFALTHRLKSDPRTSHIPVIILTAKDTVDNQLTGLETGADDYLTKPFHPILLQARVSNLLALRDQLKAKYNRLVTLQPQAQELDHPDAKFLNQLMVVLDRHLQDPEFNVTSLVGEIGMSRPVLFRKVKMLTGLSVIDLLRTTRLKKAELLLKQRKASVSEVAFAVGFSDPKYFSRAFRAQFGMTPTEYSIQANEPVLETP